MHRRAVRRKEAALTRSTARGRPGSDASRRPRLLALCALGFAVVLAGGAAEGVSAKGAKKPETVPGQLIVGFVDGVSQGQQNAAIAQAGAKKVKGFRQIDASLVEAPAAEAGLVAKALASDPRVRYVEPNYRVSLLATPNDPSFGQLWGLHNTGQTGGTPDADIDAPEAWDTQTGSPTVVVAVSDTGVDFNHPDLAAQRWTNPLDPVNGADDDGNGLVDDWSGWDFVSDDNNPFDDNDHGTHVSGTIGAVGSNGVGVTGVNWNVKIMALKFLDASGSGSTADAISATLYAADHGADVSSNSWGGGPFDQALLDAIEYGASQGMLFVAAAGNDGANNDTTATYPANYASPAVVSVAATDHNDQLAFFSNYGAKSVDLGAPGVNILSTTPGGTYKSFQGTSMATPHVSGVAALLKAQFPAATPYGLKGLLLASTDSIASLAGKARSNGRLNAANAVSCTNQPSVVLEAPSDGFKASVGEPLAISVVGANCALPAGLANVSVTVNGTAVGLSASSPDSGLYTGSYVPSVEGPVTVTAEVSAGGTTDTEAVTGTAAVNYTCTDIEDPWVDVTPGTKLSTASNSDDGFSTLNITFPFSFFGQTYTTAYVSSNGFLTLGSSAGADAFANAAIPTAANPNGLVAPFWDDLDPAAAGDVYAGLTGSAGARVLHVEWFNVPHFALFGGSGLATFELSLYEATGEIRYRYLDTDLGNATWNNGASATAGAEKVDGSFGRQISFNQPALTSGREISCTLGPPPPPPVPDVTTTGLDDATVAQAYSETLAATGGTPPYTWSLAAGSLPPGLSLNAGTGAITGAPTAAGSYPFTVRVTDSLSQSDTQALSVAVADPLAITTTSVAGASVGQAYSQTVAATGGATPYGFSLVSGSLPPGLALNSSTGEISGTPTTAGTYPFTVQATDAGNPTRADTQALEIEVTGNPPTITTSSLSDGTTTQAYSQALSATGGTGGYTWSLDSGALPPGLSLDAGSGAITGTPTTAGTYGFTALVTDSLSQSDTQALSIAVADPLAVTTTTLQSGTVGQVYAETLGASGGATPYLWSIASGTLPPGVALDGATGVVSGTPTTAGTYPFTVQVADAGSPVRTDTQGLSIVVVAGPTQVTATPNATAILTGTFRSGTAANLSADDNAYYEVNSTTSGNRTSAWYGRFTGVSNALTSLAGSYTGKNSRSCTQTVAIWRWSTSSWIQLDSRSVGTTEVAISNLLPGGTLGNYVSGSTGDGEVRVRIRCRTSSGSFFSSGDHLQITYTRP